MRGGIKWQVNEVFKTLIAFGQSKHQDKEIIRSTFNATSVSNTWHNLGKELKIYSYRTADQYRMVAVDMMKYVKQEFKLKDITKLTNEHISAYLESKIADGIKYSTFQNYSAALEKLETALNKYASINNLNTTYKFDISSIRKEAQEVLERSQLTRAYENPQALINAVKDPLFRLVAQSQLEGGFRVSELNHLSQKNFLENNTFLVISGKGGLDREVPLSEKTYNALKELALHPNLENGKFGFDMDKYRNALKQAALDSKQEYTGSHGLRWNFAQYKFFEFQQKGYGYEQSLKQVSELLGHHRADITKHYLQIA